MALQSVNHSTRCTRGRPSTSRTPTGSKVPSVQKPVEIMPATGSTKKTPRIAQRDDRDEEQTRRVLIAR